MNCGTNETVIEGDTIEYSCTIDFVEGLSSSDTFGYNDLARPYLSLHADDGSVVAPYTDTMFSLDSSVWDAQ